MRNPLNDPDVSGNSQAWMADKDREGATSHEDRYTCPGCGDTLPEHEWITELGICVQCFKDKNGGDYTSIDQADYQKGDR